MVRPGLEVALLNAFSAEEGPCRKNTELDHAIFDEDGQCCAAVAATWIAPKKEQDDFRVSGAHFS